MNAPSAGYGGYGGMRVPADVFKGDMKDMTDMG
jgi:hypothetical protein